MEFFKHDAVDGKWEPVCNVGKLCCTIAISRGYPMQAWVTLAAAARAHAASGHTYTVHPRPGGSLGSDNSHTSTRSFPFVPHAVAQRLDAPTKAPSQNLQRWTLHLPIFPTQPHGGGSSAPCRKQRSLVRTFVCTFPPLHKNSPASFWCPNTASSERLSAAGMVQLCSVHHP